MKPEPTAAMITPEVRNRLSALLGRFSLGIGILFASALLIYLGLVAWLQHDISGKAVSITQAAGLPAAAESAFRGFLPFLVVVVIFNSLVRLGLEALNPFAKASRVLPRLAVLILLGLAGSLLPTMLRHVRGVDSSGLPITMRHSDPLLAEWFAPNGTSVLFYSVEDDGNQRFWNRPGTTPDSGVPSNPVTREVRKTWKRQIDAEAARKAENQEASRKAEEEHKLTAERIRQEEEARHAAVREEEARRDREARENTARLAVRESEARAEEARRRAEAEQARAAAENARAAKLAEEREQLREEIQASRERERKQVVSRAFATNKSSTSESSATSSRWHTIHLRPGIYFTARGRAGERVEVRSDGQGAYHLPDGSPPVAFRSGTCSFHNPFPECRFVCGQSGPLEISYRWSTP